MVVCDGKIVTMFVSLLDDKKYQIFFHYPYHSVQTSSRGVLLLFAKLIRGAEHYCVRFGLEMVESPNLHKLKSQHNIIVKKRLLLETFNNLIARTAKCRLKKVSSSNALDTARQNIYTVIESMHVLLINNFPPR